MFIVLPPLFLDSTTSGKIYLISIYSLFLPFDALYHYFLMVYISLNLGTEFVWLDILCLPVKQVSNNPDRKTLLKRVYLPTFRLNHEIFYLGREFGPYGWKDELHWTLKNVAGMGKSTLGDVGDAR